MSSPRTVTCDRAQPARSGTGDGHEEFILRFHCRCMPQLHSELRILADLATGAGRPVPPRWGRPAPTIPGVGFSITHTASLIGCAVAANDAVGLDAERPADVAAALAHVGAPRVLSDSETARVASAGPAERTKLLGTLWTLKEAYAKAIGAGLRAPLDALSFSLPLAVLATWALLDGEDWRTVLGVSALLVAVVLLGRRIARPHIQENVRNAREAERRNREIARLHRLEVG